MTKFTIDIKDPSGITAAREAHNAANAEVEGFTPIATDGEYVQFVMDNASASYARQFAPAKVITDNPALVGEAVTVDGKPTVLALEASK